MVKMLGSVSQGVLVVALVLCIFRFAISQENNVCPTYKDYYTIRNNSRCWYDLAAEFNAPEVIRRMGYPVVEYKVQTGDGYILTVFRIPNHNANNPTANYHPVYLQHGLGASCDTFVASGRNSLAFVLWEAGYDVWLGNCRGTVYSEGHINLTVYDQKFWDHGLDEVIAYDFPAIFQTILDNSLPGSKILFIGHSLGTTAAMMYGSEFPEESERMIKLYVLLCPAYTLTNMISPYRKIAPFGDLIVDIVRRQEAFRIVSQTKELSRLVVPFCMESPPTMQYCMQLYNLFFGRETDLGVERIPVFFNQVPGGTSIRILNHAAQLVLGNFAKYDFKGDNFRHYGQLRPPPYDIKRLHVPVYIVVSTQDWATPEADARNLWRHLPEQAKYGFRRIDEHFNHIDFAFGRHARQLVYDPLLPVLNEAMYKLP